MYSPKLRGRHPLHELILDAFVANDARLLGGAGIGAAPDYPDDSEAEWNSVLLCTGANACGKVPLVCVCISTTC